jgi:hypothetical protein
MMTGRKAVRDGYEATREAALCALCAVVQKRLTTNFWEGPHPVCAPC